MKNQVILWQRRKRRKKKSTEKLKITLKYELIGFDFNRVWQSLPLQSWEQSEKGSVFLIRFFMENGISSLLLGAIVRPDFLFDDKKEKVPYLLKRTIHRDVFSLSRACSVTKSCNSV